MFGQAPTTSPFGAPAPAQNGFGGFGAPAQQQTAPSAFGQPAQQPSAFGQPSGFGQPAPAPTGGLFGGGVTGGFGQPAPAPTGGLFGGGGAFGQQQQQQQQQQQPFGAPAAGGGLFGGGGGLGAPAPASLFGGASTSFGAKPAGGGLFGNTANAPSGGGLFGSAAPAPASRSLFGAPAPATFGSPTPGGSLFGASANTTPAFGGPATTPSVFGAPAPSAFGTPAPSAFGAPNSGGFGQPQQQQQQMQQPGTGSTVAQYQPTQKVDGTSTIVLQAITAMQQYEQKSFEELRLEDYMAGNKGTQGQQQQPSAPTSTFGGFGAAPAPSAFGQPAPAPAFGAAPASSLFGGGGGLFGAPAPAPATGGLFGSSAPAPSAFGQPAPAPSLFGAAPVGGLFGSGPAPAPSGGLFGAAPAPAFGGLAPAPAFGAPAPATNSLFGSAPAPSAFGQQAPASAFGAPAPSAFGAGGGGLFGAPAPAPTGGGLFGSTPAPATGGLFGQPAPAPSLFGQPAPAPAMGGGLFGAPTPAKPGGLFGLSSPAPAMTGGLFGQTPAPAMGGLFGQAAPAPAPAGMYSYANPAAPTVPMPPPPSAEALLAQQLAAVENQKKEMELLGAWRGNLPSASKVVPSSQYGSDSGSEWNGGGMSSYITSPSTLHSYRAVPRSTAKIRPRGYTPTKSPASMIGMKSGSPILSPNRFVGSSTKALFIKPNSLTPKPKTRLLLANSAFNGSGDRSVGALTNGNYDSPSANIPTEQLQNSASSNANGSHSVSPHQTLRVNGSPSTPAEDFYRQVVDSNRSPSFSPQQSKNQFVPKLTKFGYTVHPSPAELEVMSEADLAAVSGFRIERPEYGSVAWDGAVDVRGVDLDSVVVIERKNVSVYDEAESKGQKPQQGSKLNRPAVITMYDVFPKDGAESSMEAKEKLKRKIEKSTKKMGADLISYEPESGVWTFRVGHFSRYGLDDDDSDDDSDDDIGSTPLLEPPDDELEIQPNQLKELRGASRIHAPTEEDESTSAYTDNMSVTEISENSETDEDGELREIVHDAEEAYALMTEEVLAECEEEVTVEPLTIEEEKALFPNEALDCFPLTETPPLKPSGSIPSTGICDRLARKCGLNQPSSSSIDFGLRMRRSFRVGWKPDGTLLEIKPSTTGAQILVQSRPVISANPDSKSSATLPLLQTHKKLCVKAIDSDPPILTLPRRTGHGNKALISALDDYSQSSVLSSLVTPTNTVVSHAFSLLVSLYGEDARAFGNVNESRRMEAVSTWLKEVVSSDTKKAIVDAQSSGDVNDSVFAALSGGDATTASALALNNGNPRLALFLSSTGAQVKPYCDGQLEMWYSTGAQQFTPTSILRIFSVANGNVDLERKLYKNSGSDPYTIDWRRRFGMCLWSSCHTHNNASLSSIVRQYCSDVSEGLAPPATPLYCADSSINTTSECILFQLLKHYDDQGMPLADILAPSSHSERKHDYSASFHLCASLTALSRSKLSRYQENLIIDSVTSQLISEGSWEWAVYASLCFIGVGSVSESSASARMLRAKKIIARFYASAIDPLAEDRRIFLQSIGVPPEWLLEAHAYRCSVSGNVFGMMENYMRFSVRDSMTVLERFVIPHMLLEGNEPRKQLFQILDSLRSKISDDNAVPWNKPNGCGMFYQFLELWMNVEKLSSMSLNQVRTNVVNIDNLLDDAANLESMISMGAAKAHSISYLAPTLVRYDFTRTPLPVLLSEMEKILATLRRQLLAINSGQPVKCLDLDSHTLLKRSSEQLSFALNSDGLYASSTIRSLCGYKAMYG